MFLLVQLYLNIVDFGEFNADLVDLQCLPEMVDGYYRACHPEPLLLKLPAAHCARMPGCLLSADS